MLSFFFFFFGLMAPFLDHINRRFYYFSSLRKRLYLISRKLKQTTIPKSCFCIVENRNPKSTGCQSSVILFVGYTWPSTHWKHETIFLNYMDSLVLTEIIN